LEPSFGHPGRYAPSRADPQISSIALTYTGVPMDGTVSNDRATTPTPLRGVDVSRALGVMRGRRRETSPIHPVRQHGRCHPEVLGDGLAGVTVGLHPLRGVYVLGVVDPSELRAVGARSGSLERSLPDSPPRVPCPLTRAWAVFRMGRPPDSRPLHIPAPDLGPWQTRQCPVEDLRLRAESPLAVSGLGRPA
jgi:hypothetical protein